MERVWLDNEGAWRHSSDKKTEQPPYKANRGIEGPEDVVSAMRDPRYQTDESYRQFVYGLMKEAHEKGVDIGIRTEPETASNFAMDTNAETIDEQREFVVNLFSDPRYKTSPTNRRMVAEFIAKHPDSNMFMQDPGSFQSVAVESGEITGPHAPTVEAGDEGESE